MYMKKISETYLTNHQYVIILIGSMVGIGMLSLPNDVVEIAKQDGWIAGGIGGIYAIYMVFIGSYISKEYPDKNILDLSIMYFGKFLGSVLNLIFISYFIYTITVICSGISNVLIMYITPFLNAKKILLTLLLVPAFIAYKGIKTLGRVNEVVFYLTLPFFLVTIVALKDGNILNLMPVFSSGIKNILKASKETSFSYSGIEILFLIYPFLNDKKKSLSLGMKAAVVTMITYMWIIFITIYYLGINVIPKFLWSAVSVSESIRVPGINSFRYITMSLWTLLIFKNISSYYFVIDYGLSKTCKKISREMWVYILYPLIIFISSLYGAPNTRRYILSIITKYYIIFNLTYVTFIAMLIKLKKGEKYAAKNEKS